MNRLEEKLGRECTDFDFDVQQIIIDQLQAEVRDAKRILWAAVRAAGGKVEIHNGVLIDMHDGVLTMWKNAHDMTTVITATRPA